jgi:hypothetical protein
MASCALTLGLLLALKSLALMLQPRQSTSFGKMLPLQTGQRSMTLLPTRHAAPLLLPLAHESTFRAIRGHDHFLSIDIVLAYMTK